MAVSLPRLLRRLQPELAHFQHALPLGFARPLGGDAARPLLRGAPTRRWGCSTALTFRPSCRAPRAAPTTCSSSPSARSATSSPATAIAGGEGDGHPERRRPRLRARAAADDGYLLFVGAIQARKDPLAALAAARRGRAAARRRRPREGRRSSRGRCAPAAPTCAATSRRTSSPSSTAAPRRSCCPRASRASGCRCSRRWPAARRSSPPTSPRCARSAGDAAVYAEDGDFAAAVARALAERDAALGRRARAREGLLVGGDGPAHGRGLPAGARVKVSAIVVSHGNAAELAESLPGARAAGRRAAS